MGLTDWGETGLQPTPELPKVRADPAVEVHCRSRPDSSACTCAPLVWVDWFNTRRLLEPIGYVPLAKYEAHYCQQTAVA